MESNRINHCYAIELALDTAAMEAEEGIATEMDTTITNTKENVMFNIDKCNIRVGKVNKAHQCKHNITSGCTLSVNGELVRCCRQHRDMFLLTADAQIPVFHFTGEKAVNLVQDAFDAMDTPTHKEMMEAINNNPIVKYSDIIITNQEEDIMKDNNFNEQLKLIVSGKYHTIKTPASGTFLVEICNHEECEMNHWEDINSARGEICCGKSECEHFYAFPCLDVQPVDTSDVPYDAPCDNFVQIPDWVSEGDQDCQTCGFRIDQHTTKIEDAKVNGRFFPNTGIFTANHKDQGYVKCVKCSKELPVTDPENDWSRGAFHPSVEQVRLCMTGTSDKHIETAFVAAKIWTGAKGDKMQTQYFAKNLRIKAVEWAKAVNGTMKTTKDGSIQVTWKLS